MYTRFGSRDVKVRISKQILSISDQMECVLDVIKCDPRHTVIQVVVQLTQVVLKLVHTVIQVVVQLIQVVLKLAHTAIQVVVQLIQVVLKLDR